MVEIKIEIEKVTNGYIARRKVMAGFENDIRVFNTLDDLFEYLLLLLEGRSTSFSGDSYGKVEIIRKRDETDE